MRFYLRNQGLPELLARQPSGRTLRAWVPACSSGEEAYTLAMAFKEALGQSNIDKRFDLLVYATDLDTDAIEKARKESIRRTSKRTLHRKGWPVFSRRSRVATASGRRYAKMVVFAQQNIISDPPFTKLDILSCRNLLIYFRSQLQKKLLPLFFTTR